ncbi:hypothetical protein [Staphylococcus sp. FSL K6-0099]|uniref:hypothetical protein n=1 Tax=Staphylococcus sp. FSL K6-0099 TaxID=2954603 RepID=UPI0030F8C842
MRAHLIFSISKCAATQRQQASDSTSVSASDSTSVSASDSASTRFSMHLTQRQQVSDSQLNKRI